MKANENSISFTKLRKYFKLNPFLKTCIQYLEEHYKLYEGAFISYQQFKDILTDLLHKITLSKDVQKDDKYNQYGIKGALKKVSEFIGKLCNRIISIVTSIGFNVAFFMLGLFTTQSVVIALIASSLYWMICLIIKSVTAKAFGTDKWYEPHSFLKIFDLKSSVDFLKSMKETVSTTIKDVFNWFFLELKDEKSKVKFSRRLMLLMLVVFLLLFMVF